MGRNKKEHLCVICNETDPNCFYGSHKGKCKSCLSNEYKKNRGNNMGRNKKEHLCAICNETDPNCFYEGQKGKCKSCQSDYYKNRKDKDQYIARQKEWMSNNILHYRVISAKHRAKRNGYDFELTDEIITQKIIDQGGLCYISKQPLSFNVNDWFSFSLDRLDSNLGYTIENTIVVTKFVNTSKSNLSFNEYKTMIKLVHDNII